MKNIVQIFFVVFVIFSALRVEALTAQTPFSYPMKPGDIAVYTVSPIIPSLRGFTTVSYSVVSGDKLRGNWDGNNDTVFISNLKSVTVNKRNMITSFYSRGSSSYTELWPYDIPRNDSIYFYSRSGSYTDSVLHRVIRRFDTTIFNRTVRAYTIDSMVTIADYFGVIRQIRNYGFNKDTLSLSSAVINGVKYNRDERTWRMQPLCKGNVYEYQYQDSYPFPQLFPHYYEFKIDRDTIITGNTYYITTYSDGYCYRETPTGIIQYDKSNSMEKLVLPYNATVGVIIDSTRSFVADTSTQFFLGAMRRIIVLETILPFQFRYTYAAGIGNIRTDRNGSIIVNDVAGYPFDFKKQTVGEGMGTLVYAKICDAEYGSYAIPPVIPLISNIQIFPNPFRDRTGISFYVLNSTQLQVVIYDHLGREIANLYEGYQEPGRYYLDFGSIGLSSAVYFCRITAGGEVYTNKMLIIK